MKVSTTPRTISLSLAAVAVAFVCGMALTSHQQQATAHLSGSYKTVDTTSTDPASTSPQVATDTLSAPTTQTTTTTGPHAPVVAVSPSSSTNLSNLVPLARKRPLRAILRPR